MSPCILSALSTFLLPGSLGLAEPTDTGSPTVTARGVAAKSFEPSMVQVRFEMGGRGATAAEAIERMEGMLRNLQSSIKALGSTGPRVRMSPPRQLGETGAGFDLLINAAMAEQQSGPRSAMGPSLRRIGVDVTLEWTLSGSPEQRLRQVDEIENQVNRLVARPKPLTLDVTNGKPEESKPESATSQSSAPSPVVVEQLIRLEYVCRVSKEEQSALSNAAMERARAAAGDMAGASKRKLGPLKTITDANDGMKGLHSDAQQMQKSQALIIGSNGPRDEVGEFRSFRLEPIEVKYELAATFELH